MLLLLMIVGGLGGGFWVDLVVGLVGLGDRLGGRMRCGLASLRDSPRDEGVGGYILRNGVGGLEMALFLIPCDSHSSSRPSHRPVENRGRDSLGQYLAQKSFRFLLIIDFRYFLEFCICRTKDGSDGCFAYLVSVRERSERSLEIPEAT